MQKVFLIYWFIGIMFVLIVQVMSLFYKLSLKARYIPPRKQVSFLLMAFANICLSVGYPIFIFSLVLENIKQRQARRFLESQIGNLDQFVEEQIKLHSKENQHEQGTESNSEKK